MGIWIVEFVVYLFSLSFFSFVFGLCFFGFSSLGFKQWWRLGCIVFGFLNCVGVCGLCYLWLL